VHVDESGIHKSLAREYGRAARGVKVEDARRGRKFHRTNAVAAQLKDSSGKTAVVAPPCYTGTMTGVRFEQRFKTRLVKSIAKGSTIILDNASFRRKTKLKHLARRHSVKLLFLPAYSPDFNPIEHTWANMKRALIDSLQAHDNLETAIYRYFDSCNN
jgi:hypothetical protein